MTLSDLKLNCSTSNYLSTAVRKVRIAMSVIGHHLILKLSIINLHNLTSSKQKKIDMEMIYYQSMHHRIM